MSKATRDRTAREKLARERKLQAQRDRQRKMIAVIGAAVAVIVVAVGLIVYINSNRSESDPEFAGKLPPTSRESDGSIVMAMPGVTSPVLEIYEDFQCPACKNLEKTSGNTFKQLAADGKAKVVFRPFRLFQQDPLKANSERAANAALCAPGDNWVPFHDKIFSEQPQEGTVGFASDDLIAWAGGLGTPITGDAFAKCVTGMEKSAQVQSMTDHAINVAKVQSTPTVKLDGKDITNDAFVPGDLRKAVEKAA